MFSEISIRDVWGTWGGRGILWASARGASWASAWGASWACAGAWAWGARASEAYDSIWKHQKQIQTGVLYHNTLRTREHMAHQTPSYYVDPQSYSLHKREKDNIPSLMTPGTLTME